MDMKDYLYPVMKSSYTFVDNPAVQRQPIDVTVKCCGRCPIWELADSKTFTPAQAIPSILLRKVNGGLVLADNGVARPGDVLLETVRIKSWTRDYYNIARSVVLTAENVVEYGPPRERVIDGYRYRLVEG